MKFIKEIMPYIIIIIVVIIIRTLLVTPAIVNGDSMLPTLTNNQIILLNKFDKKVTRFDIIVLNYNETRLVKRIIGLPGEHIAYVDNKLYVNNDEVSEDFIDDYTHDFDIKILGYGVIPDNYYFVVGDNRNNSKDSRLVGLIHIDDIIGKTSFSLFPFNKFGKIDSFK